MPAHRVAAETLPCSLGRLVHGNIGRHRGRCTLTEPKSMSASRPAMIGLLAIACLALSLSAHGAETPDLRMLPPVADEDDDRGTSLDPAGRPVGGTGDTL